MQSVSAAWAPALATAHGVSTQVSLTYNGTLLTDSVPLTDGTVTVDATAEQRRTCSVTIPDPADFPADPTDPYSVYGQRLSIATGLQYMDGTTERVPVGTFVVTEVSGDIHNGPITITGAGLELLLKDTITEQAFSTNGRTAATLISFLCGDAASDIGFVDSSTQGGTSLATKTWDAGTTYLQIIQDTATAIGADFYADANGSFRLADVPTVETPGTPVWDVSTGELGVMVSATLTLSSDDLYNKVIVTAENAADDVPPVEGSATITDTTDPLYYGGPIGKRTYRTSSDLVTTTVQATYAATALLETYRAPNRTVAVEAIPNAALDAHDWIRVAYASRAPELHLVKSFSIPLTSAGSAMSIDTVAGRDEVSST